MEEGKTIKDFKLLVIGGSAGSLPVLFNLLPSLAYMPHVAIVIVLHRKSTSDSVLADIFALRTTIPVKEIEDKEQISGGTIYIAPPDYHILFENGGEISLDFSEKVNFSRPSIDVAFESAAQVYKSGLSCLLLSGASADGAKGLQEVNAFHGKVAVQDPATADSPYMPQQGLQHVPSCTVLHPNEIVSFINAL